MNDKNLILLAGARGAAEMLREQQAKAAAEFVEQLADAYEKLLVPIQTVKITTSMHAPGYGNDTN